VLLSTPARMLLHVLAKVIVHYCCCSNHFSSLMRGNVSFCLILGPGQHLKRIRKNLIQDVFKDLIQLWSTT